MRDFVYCLSPSDVFPVIGTGAPHLRFQQTPRVQDVLFQGSALRAERAAVDGMVGIALDVDYLRRDVLGLVTNRINEDATADGAIWACGLCLGCSGDLEFAKLSLGRCRFESQECESGATDGACLQKIPASFTHGRVLPSHK